MSKYIRAIGVNLNESLYKKVARKIRTSDANLSAVVRGLLTSWVEGKADLAASTTVRSYSRPRARTSTKRKRRKV